MDSEFIRMIEEHKNSADREQKPTDFIGAYLEKMKDEQDNKESSYSGWSYICLLVIEMYSKQQAQ